MKSSPARSASVLDKNRSETISKVLYPSDTKMFGKELRTRALDLASAPIHVITTPVLRRDRGDARWRARARRASPGRRAPACG